MNHTPFFAEQSLNIAFKRGYWKFLKVFLICSAASHFEISGVFSQKVPFLEFFVIFFGIFAHFNLASLIQLF